MLLITMVGCHYFQVFGAVFGPENEVLVDPLCDSISLLSVSDDPLHLDSKFAYLLYSLRWLIAKLKNYYESIPAASRVRVPYYDMDGKIKYTQCINKRVWKGQMDDKAVIVKFTLQYNSYVHNFLAEKGKAPQLITEDQLCGGWTVIVMEYIDGKSLYECYYTLNTEQKQNIKHKLDEALQHMATGSFVHGDLRRPNIIIQNESIPFIIDFDWAGEEGVVRYPVTLNPSITWPETAQAGLPIKAQHDKDMVKKLFIENY